MFTKLKRKREEGGWANADEGGRGVGEILTMADKGWRGGWGNADKGARGGLAPPFLADIICEQPLTSWPWLF